MTKAPRDERKEKAAKLLVRSFDGMDDEELADLRKRAPDLNFALRMLSYVYRQLVTCREEEDNG